MPVAERREVAGLHPDRAPTIVAGAAILVESMRLFELDEVETSEADILHGAALDAVSSRVMAEQEYGPPNRWTRYPAGRLPAGV
ncbi:MAG: hypothetical protein WKF40_04965 [Thermoleophilaceae bacterium]